MVQMFLVVIDPHHHILPIRYQAPRTHPLRDHMVLPVQHLVVEDEIKRESHVYQYIGERVEMVWN